MATYYNPSKRLSEWAADFLSPYIKWGNDDGSASDGNQDSQKSSLSIGLWSGYIKLTNVELRPEAVERWLNPSENSQQNQSNGGKIRWKLQRGTIDSIIVKIPWKSLIVGSSHCSDTAKNTSKGNAADFANEEKNSNKLSGKPNLGSVPEKRGYMGVQQGGPEVKEQEEITSGCTTVQIEGIKLVLGYEAIHIDPQFEALQSPLSTGSGECSTVDDGENDEEDDDATKERAYLKSQIQQEKERVVQIAERRLLAGLDPFPDVLMSSLQSCVQRSMQSEIKLGAERGRHHFTAPNSSPVPNTNTLSCNTVTTKASHVSNNQNESPDKNKINDTQVPSSLLSRMENYVSSAISSLLWRAFDSLSLSVIHVQLSVMGCSHYDKDFKAIQKSKDERCKKKQEKIKHHRPNVKERRREKSSSEEEFRRYQHIYPLDSNHHSYIQCRSRSVNKGIGKGHRRVSSAYVRMPCYELSEIDLSYIFDDNHVARNKVEQLDTPGKRIQQGDVKSRGHRRISSLNSVGWGRKKCGFHSPEKTGAFDGVERGKKDASGTHAKGSLEGGCHDDGDNLSFQEDPLIWAHEGQVEIGLTLDRFDVRPGSLSRGRWGGKNSSFHGNDDTSTMDLGASSLKYFRCRQLGCFLRKHFLSTSWGVVADGEHMERAGESRTEKTLVWNNVDDFDYVVVPTDFEASCRIYRDRPEASSTVTADCTSAVTGTSNGDISIPTIKGEGFDHPSVSNSMTFSIDAKGTSTKRRGKRDKKPKIEKTVSEKSRRQKIPTSYRTGSSGLSESMLPVSFSSESNADAIIANKINTDHQFVVSSLPPRQFQPDSASSAKQPRNSILLSNAEESITHGNRSTTMPARLCIHWKMSHIRSSFTSRQFYLIHSFFTSMERMKQGRPSITIRTALRRDRSLLEHLVEDCQVITTWEDRISRTIPSIRSEYSCQYQRMLTHRVVSSWWKYAILSVVRDLRRRKMLMYSCCGEYVSCKRRNDNFGPLAASYKYNWDWAKHSRIRKEYIEQYLVVNGHSASDMSRVRSVDDNISVVTDAAAAVADAKSCIEQIEENLSVERIVLLKNIARALSIRYAELGGDSNVSQLTPADKHHIFSPNTHHKKGVYSELDFAESSGNSTQVEHNNYLPEYLSQSPSKTLGDETLHSRNTHRYWPASRFMSSARTIPTSSTVGSKKDDVDGYTMRDGTLVSDETLGYNWNQHETTPLSFSFLVTLEISGISFALCDYCHASSADKCLGYEPAGVWQQQTPSDDISALTGFSDADDSTANSHCAGRRIIVEEFDSMCRFWPSYYHGVCHEPIMITHIVNISFSIQNESRKDTSLLLSEFTIGSVAVHGGSAVPSEANIFSIGQSHDSESLRFGSPQDPIESNRMHGIAGGYTASNGSVQITMRPEIHASICSTVFNINWDWIETISEFLRIYTDIAGRRVLPSIKNESLLENRFLSNAESISPRGLLFRFDFSDIMLISPVDLYDGNHIEATVHSLGISNVNGTDESSLLDLDGLQVHSSKDAGATARYLPSYHKRKRLDTIYSSSSPFSSEDADNLAEILNGIVSLPFCDPVFQITSHFTSTAC